MRFKIVALVTIEVHARDVLEKLMLQFYDVNSFDLVSANCAFYWEKVQMRASSHSRTLNPILML